MGLERIPGQDKGTKRPVREAVTFHPQARPIIKDSGSLPMTLADYNQAVDLHADGLYRFALKHLRDRDSAKDIVQESFARLWAKVTEVDAAKAKSYLFTTAHHAMVDAVRKDGRSTRMEEHHTNLRSVDQAAPDLKEVLDAALATLPAIQRSVVLLRDLEGYSYDEIAELTGLNLAQVKVYIYRGRTALKDYIGQLDLIL
jgi:RNA polymerase sigma factor (sigma-70 family)